VRLHKLDWIQELYFKEMVTANKMEKSHEKGSINKPRNNKTSEGTGKGAG
tara:strand:+ start:2122 stop:2271 length:150 start_codon:yes stop_codon:yes gene_type:complete